MKKVLKVMAVAALAALCLTACGGEKGGGNELEPRELSPKYTENTIEATIELEDGGEIVLELYPDLAPETVDNFVDLAEDGFYDDTIFHRVVEDFVIQGGGYDEDLREQKADEIVGEFEENGYENDLSHTRGVISMARTNTSYDSATSQFFIVVEDSLFLDGKYAAFGKVIDGMDVVDDIASVRTGEVVSSGMKDVPTEPIIIRRITIDDSGADNKDKDKDKDDDKKSSSDRDDDDRTSSSDRDDDDRTSSSDRDDDDRTSSSDRDDDDGNDSSSRGTSGASGSSASDLIDEYNSKINDAGSSSSGSAPSLNENNTLDEETIRSLLDGSDSGQIS